MKLYSYFSNLWPKSVSDIYLSDYLPLCCLTVSSYSKSSSAFNSLCLSRFSYWWSMHLCCLLLFFSVPHRACNYIAVRGMMSWMTQYTVNVPTLAQLIINCPKWALETMKVFNVTAKWPWWPHLVMYGTHPEIWTLNLWLINRPHVNRLIF